MNRLTRAVDAFGGSLIARTGRVGILGSTGAGTGLAGRAPIGSVARVDAGIIGRGGLFALEPEETAHA